MFFWEKPPTLFLATHVREIYVACCELIRSLGYFVESPALGEIIARG